MPQTPRHPRLSVVVPVHNVEDYLAECLESIAAQTLTDLDVVLVDDGSTDDSPRIARAFTERDPRFRYVRQDNAGLSAARNTGVRHADPEAEFLTFVDSDDVVPHDAYERMTASLTRTGSDFATGNVWRLNERGRSQAWQYKWLTRRRERTHITRDRQLLSDRVAWNKVFRRAFWDRHAFTFPEGRLYEDTPVMIPAHFLAESVDVLDDHVYYWRVREGSITRRRTDVKGVRDRIAACDHVSRFLAERFPDRPELKKTYDASCLRDDFVYFLDGLPMGGPEYRGAFLDDTAAFLRRADPAVADGLPLDLRVKWHLVRERRLDDLVRLLSFERRNGTAFQVRGALRHTAAYPGLTRLPERLVKVGKRELPVVARVRETVWGADGKLRISGYAYVKNLAAARPGHSVRTGLLKAANSRTQIRRVPTRTAPDPRATVDSRQELHSYDHSGFTMTIDPEKLKVKGRLRPGTWDLGVVIAGHGRLRRAALRAADGSAQQNLVRDLGDGTRLVVAFTKGRLVLKVVAYAALADEHRLENDEVVLTGRLLNGIEPRTLRLTHKHSGTEFAYPVTCAGGRFLVRFPLADPAGVPQPPHRAPKEVEPAHGDRWQVNFVLPDGGTRSVAAALDLPPARYPAGGRELCATANDQGQLVVELTRQPIAELAAWAGDGSCVVEGTLSELSWREPEFVLRHSSTTEEVTVPLARGGDRFRAVVAPTRLWEGRWYAFVREADDRYGDGVPVRVLTSAGAELPRHHPDSDREFTLDRRFGDRLLIEAGPALSPADRGAYRRHRLRTVHYPAQRRLPLKDVVLYVDGDSPRAVHAELVRRGTDVEHLWVTRDGRTQVPASATGVEEFSAAWYAALARCRRIVTAHQLPDFFERRAGQTVVQTWDGTPLKRIGTDLTDTLYADHDDLALLPKLSRQWDVLVAPSRWSTPHLSRALAYDGEVLAAGSPRNDLLFAAADDRRKETERLRRDLDIAPGKRIVLYAPTYRDHLAHSPGRFRHEPALDLAAAERELAADHVLLVRKHPRTTGRLTGARAPFVRDVTDHPGAAELLLLADVLVTDYSSLMFDFAHTGRPMLFHTYDLEHYRDTVRGFYLDFEGQAPGPLLTDTAEVVGALRDLDAITARHADAYDAFRAAYCDLDDGRAAARVAERLMR
ncbi:bifunctional glycosyltransferase/CDP-glycerol:glycerophosphate glycerophosphotransferase [Streptomyces longispororuber]|uniref:bifunctional glycosyltransferase/CDP-glycerol:glycerophosphate glycerophosphotransferase n=1 Tax=Streptomyces longispororuber TaxID=68230 RepID=UPI00210A1012|nr:CDP-glycerol glycerophosphotransferase family protein [Streptomyces longispororuber]MCQ4213044.1 CDP-glycerol glycerophosphotransferase family protein [Streptomyces longispororuber]